MPSGKQPTFELENEKFGGLNTAIQFSRIPKDQSPKMMNAYQNKTGSIAKRPGTGVTTPAALGAPIKALFVYRTSADDVMATSGTTLYKLVGSTLTPQTMTAALASSNIYFTAFTDASNNKILFTTDGASMKSYNGTAVTNITPAANDPTPAPPNNMATINTKGIKYCWVYSSHVFVSDGSDTVFYSKRFTYDYFPSVQFQRFVQENDYVNGAGVAFNNALLIPMRKRWGILIGTTFDDFQGNNFLNTINGVIAPRTIQKVTYPTGMQTIVYLSDDGVYEIFDTGFQDTGTRQYSTRALMADKIDFKAIGLTDAEKQAAIAYYDAKLQLYMLCFRKGTQNLCYCMDVRNGEWYPWDNIDANMIVRNGDMLYYAGNAGTLRYFSEAHYSDWTNTASTVGPPVVFERYSALSSGEFNSGSTYWDEYYLEMKNFGINCSVTVEVAFSAGSIEVSGSVLTGAPTFVWGQSKWGSVAWAATGQYTEYLTEPAPLLFHKKARYVQVRWFNDRNEPVEIYRDKWRGRSSGV